MNHLQAKILNKSKDIDRIFDSTIKTRLSLNPENNIANSFYNIFENLIIDDTNLEFLDLFVDKFKIIVESILYHFPNSLFWDFDYFCKSLVNSKFVKDKDVYDIEERYDLILAINERFGCKSTIRFQYYHDFLYGFDWFKWMNLENREIEKSDPFGLDFLRYINNRGIEMEALIAKNSEEYGQIDDNSFRNPFYFTRVDSDELLLMRNLACNNDIPVETWKLNPIFNYRKDFSDIRTKRAFDLNISANKDKSAHKL